MAQTINLNEQNLAIQRYGLVLYFDGDSVAGELTISSVGEAAISYFMSAVNKTKFAFDRGHLLPSLLAFNITLKSKITPVSARTWYHP